MLKNAEILRKHVLFQTSYIRSSSENTPSPRRNMKAPVHGIRKTSWTLSRPEGSIGILPSSSYENLERRRIARVRRQKPWQEKGRILTRRKSEYVELEYENSLPVSFNLAKAQCMLRYYVTNTKHGKLYQIVHDNTRPQRLATAPSKWLWEQDFLIWLREGREEYIAHKYNKKRVNKSTNKQSSILNWNRFSSRKSSDSSGNGQNSSPNITVGRKSPVKNSKEVLRPTAEIFAYYNSHRIEKQRKHAAAIMIQKSIKGWYIRHKIRLLKRKALIEHGRTWKKFIEEYRELIARIQSRYGLMKYKIPIDLKQIQIFMDRKQRYEEAFRNLARGDKLPKQNLMEFFEACQLYPTEMEINKGFYTVFRGSGNTAEVVFLLDCTSNGVVTFKDQLHLVKGTVKSLDIAPDRIRVGLIPYSEGIIQSFDLKAFETKKDILQAIKNVEVRPRLTRTDQALTLMLDIFKDSRPGVQKIAIVVTDGHFSDAERTKQEARALHESGISVFVIGVGVKTKTTDLYTMASTTDHVFYVDDVKSLDQTQKEIKKSLCLEGEKTATLQKDRPLLQSEALDILWTIYPPTASGLSEIRTSKWIRPISNGQEAWSLLDEKIIKKTDLRTCLRLVIESKLARNGLIEVPSNVRAGVVEVTNPEEALRIVEEFLKKQETNDGIKVIESCTKIT